MVQLVSAALPRVARDGGTVRGGGHPASPFGEPLYKGADSKIFSGRPRSGSEDRRKLFDDDDLGQPCHLRDTRRAPSRSEAVARGRSRAGVGAVLCGRNAFRISRSARAAFYGFCAQNPRSAASRSRPGASRARSGVVGGRAGKIRSRRRLPLRRVFRGRLHVWACGIAVSHLRHQDARGLSALCRAHHGPSRDERLGRRRKIRGRKRNRLTRFLTMLVAVEFFRAGMQRGRQIP